MELESGPQLEVLDCVLYVHVLAALGALGLTLALRRESEA
jgi:hypothetical protein